MLATSGQDMNKLQGKKKKKKKIPAGQEEEGSDGYCVFSPLGEREHNAAKLIL